MTFVVVRAANVFDSFAARETGVQMHSMGTSIWIVKVNTT